MKGISDYKPEEATIDNTQIIAIEPVGDMRSISYNELFNIIASTARADGLTVEMKNERIMFIKGEPKNEKK